MKIIFIIIVFLHGLIHLLGFVKSFGIADIKEIGSNMSITIGLVWLMGAILFVAYGILHLLNFKFVWLIGLIAVLVSQFLVIRYWQDAKFAIIPNLVIFIVVLTHAGSFIMHNKFTGNIQTDFAKNNSLTTEILCQNDLAHLPHAVQKYLHYTGCVGKPKVKNFRAEFTGLMRSKPDGGYLKLHSVQYNFMEQPSRYFYMTASKMGLPSTGMHIYKHSQATFEVRLLNWLKVVDAKGEKMNQAETVTLINDMCFIAPATLIDRRIRWEEIDKTTVKAIFRNGNIVVSALLYFNSKGKLINFISTDRYHTDGKTYESYPWLTPVEQYKMLNGYMLPAKAKLIYQRPEGEFTYGELEFKSVQYNLEKLQD